MCKNVQQFLTALKEFSVTEVLVLGISVRVIEALFEWTQRCSSESVGTPNSERK